MLRFQLPIAIVLGASTLTSAVALLLSKRNENGKIQLPTHSEEVLEGDHYAHHDPLEVTRPEDVIDGYPIDEEAFWRRVRLYFWYLGRSLSAL